MVLVAAALGLAFIPLPSRLVEQLFSRGVYAAVQPVMTFASNFAPFALLDVLLGATVILLTTAMVRDVRRAGLARGAVRAGGRAVVWSAAAYLVFLAVWGLNYRREPVTTRLAYDPTAVTPAAVQRLAFVAVDRLNTLYAEAHAEGWVTGGGIDPALAGAFDHVAREIGARPRGIVVGRPKRSLLDWYFQRAGVAGMTDPIFLETLVASDVLPFERPHVVAHEWAHLAGLADEGEANVAGWLTCMRASTADQYSGWLFMYSEVAAELAGRDRATAAARLANGPRADLTAIRERTLRHVNLQLSSAGWRVYDSYLKANRIEAGTRSYSEVVQLALGLDTARGLR